MISYRNISEKSVTAGLIAVAATAMLLTFGLNNSTLESNSNNNQAIAQKQELQTNNNTIIRVEAGGGNSTDVKTVFVPQKIEIKAGQTINWYNPTPVEEPHSVAILKDSRLLPLFAVPYCSCFN